MHGILVHVFGWECIYVGKVAYLIAVLGPTHKKKYI